MAGGDFKLQIAPARRKMGHERMHYDGDISWPVLRRIVQEWAGTSAELAEVTPLDGGNISTTLLLTTNRGDKSVLKLSQHRVDRTYDREAYQLGLLRSLGLPVPQVFGWRIGTLDDPHSYLLMEFIDGVDLAHARKICDEAQFDELQRQLAQIVVTM